VPRTTPGRGQFGQAKIQNFYVAVAGDENIFGLQVAMDDSFVVRGGQAFGDLLRVFRGFARR
jgi:hypothetical protein